MLLIVLLLAAFGLVSLLGPMLGLAVLLIGACLLGLVD